MEQIFTLTLEFILVDTSAPNNGLRFLNDGFPMRFFFNLIDFNLRIGPLPSNIFSINTFLLTN